MVCGGVDQWLGWTLTNIKSGKTNHTVPCHYLEWHDRDPKGTEFVVIDKFIPHWRGEYHIREVSRLETYWVFQLKTYSPFGLNVEWVINLFINKA